MRAIKKPKGCACDPKTWNIDGFRIPAVCKTFSDELSVYGGHYCQACEHDVGCHMKSESEQKP